MRPSDVDAVGSGHAGRERGREEVGHERDGSLRDPIDEPLHCPACGSDDLEQVEGVILRRAGIGVAASSRRSPYGEEGAVAVDECNVVGRCES